jgi:hypothetical protein
MFLKYFVFTQSSQVRHWCSHHIIWRATFDFYRLPETGIDPRRLPKPGAAMAKRSMLTGCDSPPGRVV